MCLVAIACALRWGVTHVGEFNYWALLILSRENYFRYKECLRRPPSLEVALRRKSDCGFDIYIFFVKYVLKFLILRYVCIKSDVTTLETIVI